MPNANPEVVTPSYGGVANPFAMLMNPDVVIQRVERSTELRALRKRVLHPLDRPWIPHRVPLDVALSDAAIDAEMN